MAILKFSDLTGTPVVLPVIGEWTTYTPTLTNGPTTSTLTGKYRRVGSSMEIQIFIVCTGTGAAANLGISIPTGFSISTADQAAGSVVPALTQGSATWNDAGVFKVLTPYYFTGVTPNSIRFVVSAGTATLNGVDLASGDEIGVRVVVPILEWAGQANLAYGLGEATALKSGAVSIAAQSFAGVKTYNDGVKLDDDASQTTLAYYREGTITSGWLPSGVGSTGSSAVITQITRVGRKVTIAVPQTMDATVAGTSNTLNTTVALPTWARPPNNIVLPLYVRNGGTSYTVGVIEINTVGNLSLWRDVAQTPFTNGTGAGNYGTFTASYSVA